MTYAHTIPGGAAWSAQVAAGSQITLTAQGPSSMASMLLFAADRLDRLNVPDTMKAQMSACVKPPMVLMSDRGTALASVISASQQWHDCLTGLNPDQSLLRIEMAKYGLGEADLHAPVNWFVRTGVADDNRASFTGLLDATTPGDTVVLRAEQDVLMFLATGALDAVGVEIGVGASSDANRAWREESARALEMAARVGVSR